MTHRVPVAIALYSEIFDTVDGCASIVATHNSVVSHVRLGDAANHVVMNGVLSEQEGLANVIKLQVLDSANDCLVTRGVQHDMGSKLISS